MLLHDNPYEMNGVRWSSNIPDRAEKMLAISEKNSLGVNFYMVLIKIEERLFYLLIQLLPVPGFCLETHEQRQCLEIAGSRPAIPIQNNGTSA